MFYKAWIHTPNPQEETIYLSDPRTPAEMGAALAGDGYLVSTAGGVLWAEVSIGGFEARTFKFTGTGQVVLFPQHLIRLDEIVIEPGTETSET